jgi:GAF domain-containing protein
MSDQELKRLLEGLLSDTPRETLSEAVPEDTTTSGEGLDSWAKLERYALRLQTASQISHAASSILSLDELLPQAVDLIRKQFGFYYVGIFLIDASGWAVLQAGTEKAGRLMVEQGHRLQVGGDSMIGWCIAHQQARIALDVGEEAVRFDNPLLPDTRSEMALPLISRGQAIGAMTFQSANPAAFSEEDTSVLQSMADQLANAIENARLFEDRERRIAELAIVNEIGQAVSSIPDLDLLLETVYRQVSRLFDTTNFYIAAYEEKSSEWVLALDVEHGERQPVSRHDVASGLSGYIIRNRQPLLLRTAREFEDWHQTEGIEFLGERAKSWLGVPLIVADRVVGVMAIQDYGREDRYDDQDVTLFSTVAGQVANALENVRLLTQTHRRAQEMEALNEVARAITSVLDLDTVLRQIVDTTKGHFGHYFVGILLLEGDELVFRSGSLIGDSDVRWQSGGLRLALDGYGLTVATVNSGQSILLNDVRTDSRYGTAPGLEPVQAELDTPIMAKGQAIGVLTVQSDRPYAFDQDDVALLQSLASQAAVAIDNARLFEQARIHAEEQAILNEMGRALNARLDVDAALYNLYRYAAKLMDTTNFYVALYDPATEYISFPLAVQNQEQLQWSSRHKGQGLTEYVLRTREPLLIAKDVRAYIEEHLEGVEHIGDEAQSWLGVPLTIGNQAIGVVAVQSFTTPGLYNERYRDLLAGIARQAAAAFENARLLAQTQQSAERARALYETSRALSSHLEEEALMHTILEAVYHTLACEYAMISIVDEAAGIIACRHIIWHGQFDVFPEWILMVQYPLDHPDITPDVYRTGRTEIIGEWDERFNRAIWEQFGHERLLRIFMPIKLRDRVLGVIEMGYDKKEKKAVDEQEVQLLSAFVDQAAIALQNVRLLEQAEDRARRERTLREITTHVRASTDPEAIMRTAVRDLGTALRRPVFIRLGSADRLSGTAEASGGDGHSRDLAQEGGD